MIELYELRQLAAFAEAGTLSEAAEVLHLSQPALSRNMKKLEEDLGISLFERSKNKLELNKNGEYALKLARKLLDDADSFITRVRDFERKSRTITLGICAPAPVWTLAPMIANLFPGMSLQTEMDREDRLLKDLKNNVYQLTDPSLITAVLRHGTWGTLPENPTRPGLRPRLRRGRHRHLLPGL